MNTKIIARNSFWMVLDSVLGILSALVTSIAIARVIGPEKLGYFNYVIWLSSISGTISSYGLALVLRKYLAEFQGRHDLEKSRALLAICFRAFSLIAAVLVCAGLVLVFTLVPPEHQLYSALAVISLLPSVLMSLPSAANAAVEDMAPNVWASLVSTPINLVGVALALTRDWGLVGLTGTFLVSRTIDFAVRYALFRVRFPSEILVRFTQAFSMGTIPKLPAEVQAQIKRFLLQTTMLRILDAVVWDRSELFFLKQYSEIHQLAFYSLSFNSLQQALLLPQIFVSATSLTMMVQQGRDPKNVAPMTATTIRYVALLALPITLGIAALSTPLVTLLYGDQYLPVIPVLTIVALFSIPVALVLPIKQMLIATNQQGFLLKWGCVAGIINIALDLWWIPDHGAIGAAMGNGVAQLVASVGLYVFAVWKANVPSPGQGLLKTLVSAGVMALIVAGLAQKAPPALAIAAGVPIGVLVFLLMVRWTRNFEAGDLQRLMGLRHQLPPWLRNAYSTTIQMVVLS